MGENRRGLSLSDQAIQQAKDAKEWYPHQYRSATQFFEIAGDRLYKMLKRRKEREANNG